MNGGALTHTKKNEKKKNIYINIYKKNKRKQDPRQANTK